MTTENYVHGYSEREALRLYDQARSVQEFIHYDTAFPAGSRVLEAGCGVGAQTVTLAEKSPQARIVSADIAADSLNRARNTVREKGLSNVEFYHADVFDLPFREEDFDHLFVCYLLEHLPTPDRALTSLRRVLKSGGSVTVIEGDHGSCYFHPETEESLNVWNCLIRVQESLGGKFAHRTAGFSFVETERIPGYPRVTENALYGSVRTRADGQFCEKNHCSDGGGRKSPGH